MPSDEDIARAFHDAYERLAPSFGYSTRTSSAKPWAMVPAANKALMIATVGEVRALLGAATTPTAPPLTGHMIAPGVPCHGCQTCLVPDCEPCAFGENCAEHGPTEDTTPTAEPDEVCSKCGTAGCLEDARSGWYDDPPIAPDHPTRCSCGRALPCRHCPEETTP